MSCIRTEHNEGCVRLLLTNLQTYFLFHLARLQFFLVKVIECFIISLNMYCRQVALISDTVLTLYSLPFTFRDTFLLQLVMDFSCLMQCQVYLCTSNQFKLTTVAITYIFCCIKWYITHNSTCIICYNPTKYSNYVIWRPKLPVYRFIENLNVLSVNSTGD